MLEPHKKAFIAAAKRYKCIIGVRDTNILVDRWVGQVGFIPKPVRCKAKTADNPFHECGGLVVDPTKELMKDAFKDLGKALRSWKKFTYGANEPSTKKRYLPQGFTIDEDGPDAGVVRYGYKFIHSDYDLMGIYQEGDKGEVLNDSRKARDLFKKIQAMVNGSLHTPMIQHGPEMQFDKGVGSSPSESILWFEPAGNVGVGVSYMAKEQKQ